MYKRILVAIDSSTTAQKAQDESIRIAKTSLALVRER